MYIAAARECRQALREVQPGDCPIIPGYLPSLPLRGVAFLPPFLLDALPPFVEELLCLLLLAGAFLATVFAAAFALVLRHCSHRRFQLGLLLRQLFCWLRGLQGEPFSLGPVLGTAVRVLAVLVPPVLLPRKACLEQSGPGGFEDLLLYLAEGRHEF